MRENVKMEVAFEIITMRIALAIENNNIEEVQTLNNERKQLYEGNEKIFKKIYEQYSKEIKAKIAPKKITNAEIEKIKEKYTLTEEELEEMYKKARDLIIGDCQPAKGTPTAIVTGGQPGAGKIGLVLKSKRDMMERNKETVIIDSDAYRGLYKNSMEIASKYPELYSEITDKATGKITKRLLQEVVDNGYNFIFEGIMGKIDIIETLEQAPHKYDIIARLMATSRAESLLSIFERYIVMLENMGIGRLATIDAHNTRYNNFTEVAKVLENRNVEVEVYERTRNYTEIGKPIMIYKTSREANNFKTVEDALCEGRKKSYELCFDNNIKERLEIINKDLKQLSENNQNIENELKNLNQIFMSEFLNNMGDNI